jgi:hypothetical protein
VALCGRTQRTGRSLPLFSIMFLDTEPTRSLDGYSHQVDKLIA